MGAKQSQSPHYRSCSESNGSPSDDNQASTSDAVHRYTLNNYISGIFH